MAINPEIKAETSANERELKKINQKLENSYNKAIMIGLFLLAAFLFTAASADLGVTNFWGKGDGLISALGGFAKGTVGFWIPALTFLVAKEVAPRVAPNGKLAQLLNPNKVQQIKLKEKISKQKVEGSIDPIAYKALVNAYKDINNLDTESPDEVKGLLMRLKSGKYGDKNSNIYKTMEDVLNDLTKKNVTISQNESNLKKLANKINILEGLKDIDETKIKAAFPDFVIGTDQLKSDSKGNLYISKSGAVDQTYLIEYSDKNTTTITGDPLDELAVKKLQTIGKSELEIKTSFTDNKLGSMIATTRSEKDSKDAEQKTLQKEKTELKSQIANNLSATASTNTLFHDKAQRDLFEEISQSFSGASAADITSLEDNAKKGTAIHDIDREVHNKRG